MTNISKSDLHKMPLFKKLNDKGIDLIYNQGNYPEAIRYFDKILAIDPNNIDATFFKCAALTSLGNSSEAIPFIDKALMLSDKILAIDPNKV